MKKYLFWIICSMLIVSLASCGITSEETVTEDQVATQVSIILTETAIHQPVETEPTATQTLAPSPTVTEPEPEATPTHTPTETPTETATSTPDQDDPAGRLGTPAWSYDFSGDSSPWDFESTQAIYRTQNGYLNMTARANPNWHNWWVSSPSLKDAYVEATIQMSDCSGRDRFGLIVRASSDGQQFYYLSIACDGRRAFFRMAEDVNIHTILGYETTDAITPGLAEPHRIGIWMQGSDFKLYINGQQVGTARDTTITDVGYTGFLIAYENTPGYTVRVDTLKYWNLP